MMARRLYFFWMMVAYVCIAYASPSFYTQRLKCIAQAVGVQLPDTLQPEKEYAGIWTFKQRSLRVRTNAFGDVTHIGYCLFDERMYTHYEYQTVLDFAERYALELTLGKDEELRQRLRITDKVTCVEGSLSMLDDISPRTPVTIDQRQLRMFRIKWTLDEKTILTLSFPADFQLISGANAIELEKMFERDVQRIVPLTQEDMLINWNDVPVVSLSAMVLHDALEKKLFGKKQFVSKDPGPVVYTTNAPDGLLMANQGIYLNGQIRSDVMLVQKKGKRMLFSSTVLPIPSVRNLLLTGQFPTIVPLKLTIDCYGNKKQHLDGISLQQFVGLCRMEGCELYVGIKQKTDTAISATVFAVNRAMAYNHVLSVNVPLRVFQEANVPISGTLYTYIPLQNVDERFFTQDLNN